MGLSGAGGGWGRPRGDEGGRGGTRGTPAGQYEWRIRQRRRWGGGKVFKPQEVSALFVPALLSPPPASSYSDRLLAGVRNINSAPSHGSVLLWLLDCFSAEALEVRPEPWNLTFLVLFLCHRY